VSYLISAREVFSVFYGDDIRSGGVAVLFRAWFDDSKDGNAERYTLAGGLIGNIKAWRDFEKKWKAVLYAEPRIEWFHTKEWRSLTGQFGKFRDPIKWPTPKGREAADAKRNALRAVIESSSLVAMGVGVLIQDFKKVREADPRAANYFRPDPYEGALQSFVYESAIALRRIPGLHQLGYVSDDSEKAAIYTAVYTDFKAKNPDIAQTMRGLSHLDDKKWPGLQAADMIANISNQVFKTVWDKPEGEREIDSLPELEGNFYKIAHWDLRYMCHILLTNTGVDLFDKFGIEKTQHKSDEQLAEERADEKRFKRGVRAWERSQNLKGSTKQWGRS
jgi:Protein of unknown function (DUF3800)